LRPGNDNQSGRLRGKSELGRLKSRAIEDGLLSVSGDADFDIQQHRFNNLGQFITFLNPFSGFSGFLGRSRTIQSINQWIFFDVLADGAKITRETRETVVGAASSDENLKEAWMRCLNLRELESFRHILEPISLPLVCRRIR
jgi:hypothetical protein